jgi:RNA polymerase sigma factor (sigma-70 family)
MPTRTTDEELVRQALAGESAAFAELVDRYRDAVCGVAYHYLGDFDAAQDAAQEAFVKAYLHLSQLRDASKFGPWLRRIAAAECLGALRRRGDLTVSIEEIERQSTATAASDAESESDRLAARLVVRETLGRLSDKTRLTLTLFHINGYSHAEIADFLEVPLNTVRSRLQRARKQLREEMITMVSDVLNEGKPDEEFTPEVIEEIMRRGGEAWTANAHADSLRYYDEALEALDKAPPSAERERLRIKALRGKAFAVPFLRGWEEQIRIYREALAVARETGERWWQAATLETIAAAYANMQQREAAEKHSRQALRIYRELGDAPGQARCMLQLGGRRLHARETASARHYFKQALPLFEVSDHPEGVAGCRAALDLFAEIGEDKFRSLLGWGAGTVGIDARDGVLANRWGSGHGSVSNEVPAPLSVHDVFSQISHLWTFLDLTLPVGGSWSGNAHSMSHQPLRATVTVRSNTESVAVPAGTFARSLLTEQVTTESGLPDDAPEDVKQHNRRQSCGTRRAWYAPGVGLVQLHVERSDGVQALIQLKEFSVQGESSDYLPLAIGNTWAYGWADSPAAWVAKETYRVTGHKGDRWYLEHYMYCYKEP